MPWDLEQLLARSRKSPYGVQVSAKAWKIFCPNAPNWEKHLHRYALELALQGAQLAACNFS